MHQRTRIIFVILIFSLLAANCYPPKVVATQEPTLIDWKNLQITPKTDDDLCTKTLPEELDTGEGIKQDFTSGLAIGFLPEDLSTPNKIAYDTYWVNANEQLSFNWLFWYPQGNEGSLNLRLFILLVAKCFNCFVVIQLFHNSLYQLKLVRYSKTSLLFQNISVILIHISKCSSITLFKMKLTHPFSSIMFYYGTT